MTTAAPAEASVSSLTLPVFCSLVSVLTLLIKLDTGSVNKYSSWALFWPIISWDTKKKNGKKVCMGGIVTT